MLKITVDEVNFLVHQYLEEMGYKHSAFSFKHEANVEHSPYIEAHLHSGLLLMYLEKALLLVQMETHLTDCEESTTCNQPFYLLNPHICSHDSSHPSKRINHQFGTKSIGELQEHKSEGSSKYGQTFSNAGMPPVSIQGGISSPSELIAEKMKTPIDQPCDKKIQLETTPIEEPMLVDSSPEEKVLEENKSNLMEKIGDGPKGVRDLTGHKGWVYSLAWHPSKRLLASGGQSFARLWKFDGIEEKMGKPQAVKTPGTQPESWRQGVGEISKKLPHVPSDDEQKEGDVICLNWSKNRGLLLSGASDGIARVWDEEGELKQFYSSGNSILFAAKWNPESTHFLTADGDGQLNVYEYDSERVNTIIHAHSGPIYDTKLNILNNKS